MIALDILGVPWVLSLLKGDIIIEGNISEDNIMERCIDCQMIMGEWIHFVICNNRACDDIDTNFQGATSHIPTRHFLC